MTDTDYRAAARRKFPFGELRRNGRWACVRRCGQGRTKRWRISLHVDQEHAERAAARECAFGCQGPIAYHFTLPIAPPEISTAPNPKPVAPQPPPLIAMMRP